MIHILTTDRLQICLVKTGNATPFISALELRKLMNTTYLTRQGSLQTFIRADVGATVNQGYRFISFKTLMLKVSLKRLLNILCFSLS
jgi:hypothetical protein